MKKHISKFVSLALALCMMVCMSATAFAAEIKDTGGNGSVPVTLSSVDDSGTAAPTALKVTIPTSLPVSMNQDGVVTTTDAKLTNRSYGAVRVKTVTITSASNWKLTAYDTPASFAALNNKVDSNLLGFSIGLGNGDMYSTNSENENSQVLISAPVDGCYMSGVGNLNANSIAVKYDAVCTPLSSPVTNATIANVVFVVEWDT